MTRKSAARRGALIPSAALSDFSDTPDLSCLDWEQRIQEGLSLMPAGLPLDLVRAGRAREVFDLLRLPDVPDRPSFADAGGEWFKEIVGAVFGTWNGRQRAVNEFFVLVPKKSSKTTGAAGIMVTAMLTSERPRAEFLLVAPTHQVAELAFSQAVGMIEADPTLSAKCQVQEYIKKIIFRPTGASLRIKSFDPSILTGSKPSGVLLDELHVIAEHPKADRVLGQLRGGLVSQPESFMITITTQSERVPTGIFRTELMKARKVRDGALRLKMLPILYEFPASYLPSTANPDCQEWRNPANWWMVTPNRGLSITIPRLQEDYASAVAAGEEELRRWASQHLNIEIGLALRSDHWVGAQFWPASAIAMGLDELLARAEVITVGIDGGGLDDMLALSVLGRDAKTQEWLAWSHAWLHTVALERRKSEISTYRDFETDGDLSIVDKPGDDLVELGEYVERVNATGKLDKIGVDPAGIGSVIDELVERGIDQEKQIVGITQGWRLTAAIKTTERKLFDGSLLHSTQSLTRWAAENARVEPRGNAIIITKQASGTAKIDPLMATLNAVELMSRNPGGQPKYQVMFV